MEIPSGRYKELHLKADLPKVTNKVVDRD